MKVGNNAIQINVLAEDGITNKKYELIVHRRNEQEQIQYEEERKIEAEKLSTILEKQNDTNNANEENESKNKNIIELIGIIILGSTIIAIVIYIIKKQKKLD